MFRHEFKTAVDAIRQIHGLLLSVKCSIIAMSATFRKVDQDVITHLLGSPPSSVMWLELSCRRIRFDAVCCGNPTASITSAMKQDASMSSTNKTIAYTNSKMKAQGSLSEACDKVLEYAKSDGVVIPITGDDRLQFKVFVMHAFAQNYEESAARAHEDGTVPLPKLMIMPATSAANCGVSSIDCHRSYRIVFPPSMYPLVQELGRVDRDPSAEFGDNRYEVHFSFSCLVSLYIRIMQSSEKIARESNLLALFDVLKFIVLPTKYQHIMMEVYFEDPLCLFEKEPCGTMCCYCDQAYTPTGRIHRYNLQNCLIAFFASKRPSPKELVQYIKQQRLHIFHKNDMPKMFMGPIHALCIQLLGTGIIDISIKDDKKTLIGKTDLSSANVVVHLGVDNCEPRLLIDRYWEDITTVSSIDDAE